MSEIKKRKIAFAEMFRIFHIKNKYFVIYPHKCILNNLKKKYQEKWENAYLRVKNARASRALRRALNPGQYWLALLARLRFATSAKSRKIFLGPPLDQILDPLVIVTIWGVILLCPFFWGGLFGALQGGRHFQVAIFS